MLPDQELSAPRPHVRADFDVALDDVGRTLLEPLGLLRLLVDRLGDPRLRDEERAAAASGAARHLAALERVADRLAGLGALRRAGAVRGPAVPLALGLTARAVVVEASGLAAARGVALALGASEGGAWVLGEQELVERVARALVEAEVAAAAPGARVRVDVDERGAERALVIVRQGDCAPPGDGLADGGGALALALAAAAASALRGSFTVEAVDRGRRLRLSLPAAPPLGPAGSTGPAGPVGDDRLDNGRRRG